MNRLYLLTSTILVFFLLYSCQGLSQIKDRGHIFSTVTGINSEPVIFNDVNLNTYELFTSNVQVSDENNIQKIVFSPGKILESKSDFLRETKVNITQQNGISTFGFAFGFDNSSPFSKRGDKLFDKITLPSQPPQDTAETDYQYQQTLANYNDQLNAAYTSYYESLLRNSFKFTVGYNISLFEIIGGDKVDMNNDSIVDNFHTVRNRDWSLSGTYTFSSKSAVTISGHLSSILASAAEDQERVPFTGWSVAFAHRIVVLDKNYKTSDDYVESLFVPSILFGISIESQRATDNEEFAENGITQRRVYTPYLDFRFSPSSQFRLGVPIQRFQGINDEVSFGPFLQWSLQIAKRS